MPNDNEVVAAAILAAGFAAGQRQPLSGGVLEDSLKEKYVEFLAFIRAQNVAPNAAAASPASKPRGSAKRKK